MSREERKMAQIIASIERMEQLKPGRADGDADGDSNGSGSGAANAPLQGHQQPHAAVVVENDENSSSSSNNVAVTAASAAALSTVAKPKVKAKKLRGRQKETVAGQGKVKSSSRRAKRDAKAIGVTDTTVVRARTTTARVLPPKKRWIQAWNAQMQVELLDAPAQQDQTATDSSSSERPQSPVAAARPSDAVVGGEERQRSTLPATKTVELANAKQSEEATPNSRVPEGANSVAQPQTNMDVVINTSNITDVVVAAPAQPQQVDEQVGDDMEVDSAQPKAAATVPVEPGQIKTTLPAEVKEQPHSEETQVTKTLLRSMSAPVMPVPVTTASTVSVTPSATIADTLRVSSVASTELSHLSPTLNDNNLAPVSISPCIKAKEIVDPAADATSPIVKGDASSVGAHSGAKALVLPTAAPAPPAVKEHSSEIIMENTRPAAITTAPTSPCPRPNVTADAQAVVVPETSTSPPRTANKRSRERMLPEDLTQDELQRLERRRKRRTNWDVGDPRLTKPLPQGISADDKKPPMPPGAAHPHPAASPHSSGGFGKFGFGRPPWRQGDKPPYHGGAPHHHGQGHGRGGRRFFHSHSLPLERSRNNGAGRAGRFHGRGNNGSYR
ncbi:TPA: hypothetical protein N0F65_010684 [Lagenidium giganteum]|uniref:Uncharacterized protein n=1 Tax=Lagenidium giganteum TaxID=4803 RepID=A0AAV2Z5W9_9STRA|nr:TPA: hypothetical protein N0F65_010684 [Lagenidium giganteum]